MALQRADIRTKYNLQGNCIVDIATACCCALCDLVQQEKEVSFRGAAPPPGGIKEQYQPAAGMSYPAPAPAQ